MNFKFLAWLKRARIKVVDIDQRVKSLNNVYYAGCGYHYSMVNRLETLQTKLAVTDEAAFHWNIHERLLARVCLKMLCEDVFKAERSAQQLAK